MRGSIEKRGNGYRITIHLGYDEDGKPQRHRETVSTKKVAEDTLRARLEEIETEGRISERTRDTLETYMLTWLERVKQRQVSARTFELYTMLVKRHLVGAKLGKLPMVVIRAIDIEDHYELMLRGQPGKRKVGPPTVHMLHTLIAGAFHRAARRRDVVQSPCVYMDPLPAQHPKKTAPLALEDFSRFVQAALEEPTAPLWILLLMTGMRPEESLALKWPDIQGNSVRIERALIRPYVLKPDQPAWYLGPTKTKRPRHVAIEDSMIQLLRAHRARQAEHKLAAGPAYQDHGFVFATELGEPLKHKHLLMRVLPRIAQKAGLDKLTIYSLRHGAATGLLRRGEGLKVVSEMLGHKSVKVTGDYYAHVHPDQMERAASVLGAAMGLNSPR